MTNNQLSYSSYAEYREKCPSGTSCRMEYTDPDEFRYMFVQNTSNKATVYFQRIDTEESFCGVCLLELSNNLVSIRDLFYEYINEERDQTEWSATMTDTSMLLRAIQLFMGDKYQIKEALEYDNNDWRFTMQLNELNEYKKLYEKYVLS